GLAEVFRDATTAKSQKTLAEVVQDRLRDKMPSERIEVRYRTPGGDERVLEVTVTSVESLAGEPLGAACLINDQPELACIRRQQMLRGEISAEMALELRNSLNTISDCAKRLGADQEESVRRLAADIASEAAHIDHTIGGFLAESRSVRAVSGI